MANCCLSPKMPTTSRNSPKQSTDTPESMVSSFFNSQSKPNSVPSDVDQQAAADKVALYHPRDNDDHTKSILSSFLKYLPTEGKQSLAEFIMRDKVDDDVLYSLSNHLFSFILFPSEFIRLYATRPKGLIYRRDSSRV